VGKARYRRGAGRTGHRLNGKSHGDCGVGQKGGKRANEEKGGKKIKLDPKVPHIYTSEERSIVVNETDGKNQ